jgi:hypothetical protein
MTTFEVDDLSAEAFDLVVELIDGFPLVAQVAIDVVEFAVALLDRFVGLTEAAPHVVELLVQEHVGREPCLALLAKRFVGIAHRSYLEGQGSADECVALVLGAVERCAAVHDRQRVV